MDFPTLIPSKKAEVLLGLASGTLATWRSKQTPNQPPYTYLGSVPRYDVAELKRWLAANQVRH